MLAEIESFQNTDDIYCNQYLSSTSACNDLPVSTSEDENEIQEILYEDRASTSQKLPYGSF